ncbi:unnamed protein product [Miscanthus lutarioriparius]|uniref:F-box/LRR-repeat protein 15/At3g58940/PEG3-like LRR domain-containing protein n=1 Tax=Miscanthus lutarioriparius TaxID=422564 RepID=A0A811NSV3_9POAL|nr:unnamed protein product [Miscanthus lutarioriparius]
MEVVFRSKRRRKLAKEEEHIDYISCLPDTILRDIISLLPTKNGECTHVFSSCWCQIWRSAPLNLDLNPDFDVLPIPMYIPTRVILRILSTHQGPIHRLSIPEVYLYYRNDHAMILDIWLRFPTVDRLQELEFQHDRHCRRIPPLPPLPTSVHCFSSTLRVASFGHCNFLGGNSANRHHFLLLKNLSLFDVNISESSLHSLLASCPILESLLLIGQMGCSHIQIVSPTLRSICVCPGYLNFELPQLIIDDAPCLERLLHFQKFNSMKSPSQ